MNPQSIKQFGAVNMKAIAYFTVWAACSLLFCSEAVADAKEISSIAVTRVNNDISNGEFQLQLRCSFPTLPIDAHVDDVVLFLDQTYDPSKGTPKGISNLTKEPILLSVGVVAAMGQTGRWVEIPFDSVKRVAVNLLPPATIVQEARKSANWPSYAMQFFVADLVRDRIASSHSDLLFVISGTPQNRLVVTNPVVSVDPLQFTGRLVINYTVEPALPPWHRKK